MSNARNTQTPEDSMDTITIHLHRDNFFDGVMTDSWDTLEDTEERADEEIAIREAYEHILTREMAKLNPNDEIDFRWLQGVGPDVITCSDYSRHSEIGLDFQQAAELAWGNCW